MIDKKDFRAGEFGEQDATPFSGSPDQDTAKSMTATEAKNRFGELIDMARREPVSIRKNGRAVAVVLSPEEYGRLRQASSTSAVRPRVEQLLERSIRRRKSLYQALAR